MNEKGRPDSGGAGDNSLWIQVIMLSAIKRFKSEF